MPDTPSQRGCYPQPNWKPLPALIPLAGAARSFVQKAGLPCIGREARPPLLAA
jgi:hypothetical protein